MEGFFVKGKLKFPLKEIFMFMFYFLEKLSKYLYTIKNYNKNLKLVKIIFKNKISFKGKFFVIWEIYKILIFVSY